MLAVLCIWDSLKSMLSLLPFIVAGLTVVWATVVLISDWTILETGGLCCVCELVGPLHKEIAVIDYWLKLKHNSSNGLYSICVVEPIRRICHWF